MVGKPFIRNRNMLYAQAWVPRKIRPISHLFFFYRVYQNLLINHTIFKNYTCPEVFLKWQFKLRSLGYKATTQPIWLSNISINLIFFKMPQSDTYKIIVLLLKDSSHKINNQNMLNKDIIEYSSHPIPFSYMRNPCFRKFK